MVLGAEDGSPTTLFSPAMSRHHLQAELAASHLPTASGTYWPFEWYWQGAPASLALTPVWTPGVYWKLGDGIRIFSYGQSGQQDTRRSFHY